MPRGAALAATLAREARFAARASFVLCGQSSAELIALNVITFEVPFCWLPLCPPEEGMPAATAGTIVTCCPASSVMAREFTWRAAVSWRRPAHHSQAAVMEGVTAGCSVWRGGDEQGSRCTCGQRSKIQHFPKSGEV
ncbi:hypothetical protein O3P69_008493 [Scylla paramamosain]|uniref:Uncharacterized protein n=1 Tax=Scylla paramamosain TaxID=85552 RepID=A0AAW0SKT7_SCYPA